MLENETQEVLPPTTAAQPGHWRFFAATVLVSIVAGFLGGYMGAQRSSMGGSGGDLLNQSVVVQEDSAVVDVVKRASPAVVSIVISKDLSLVPGFSASPFELDPFSQFFGFGYGRRAEPTPAAPNVQQVGAGSGFFVSADGTILTNRHVVSDASASYTVLTSDGQSHEAKVLALDPVNDLAIIKINITNAPTLTLADSGSLQRGQKVIAIGNSLGQYANTVTTGVVSGIGRSITAGGSDGSEQLEGVVQTDAAINPGNSGGPLLNVAGQVIGINTAIDREGQLVGFAIPSNDAKKALDSFTKNGKITRAYLGVRYLMITKNLVAAQKLPRDFGALVVRGESAAEAAVVPGGPADKAGIVENDIILEVNSQKLDEAHTLAGALRNFSAGDTVTLKVYHKGEEKTVQVRLEEAK